VGLSKFCLSSCLALPILVFVVGCPSGGPATVPVQGTLTIGGQPAKDVTITLVPSDPKNPTASGKVENGSFRLFSGVEGKPGVVPGKYKVILYFAGAASANMYQRDRSGTSSAPPKVEVPFAEKYQDAKTSDKEVEITDGPNDLKIDVPAK
jgi:hypothetical protein